jgi:DNA topoisomerase-3
VLGATGRQDGWLEGHGLQITWCLGHLVELEEPSHYQDAWKRWSFETLPMLPEEFSLRPRKGGGTDERLKVLRKLLKSRDIDCIINACDAGREGELIFRFVYEMLDCRLPVERLWVSSLTDSAIKAAWGKLRPGDELVPLSHAARCRAESDWLVGLNATRALTCLARKAGGEQLLSVGRVQTPTLAMIVDRDQAIADFVPEKFWRVEAQFQAQEAEWKGRWFRPQEAKEASKADKEDEDEAPHAERILSAEAAQSIVDAIEDQAGTLAMAERKQTTEKPPLLYDLTSLQRRANQRYGFTAARTLELAQALYERHKLITYPRTDARFLTPDQVEDLPRVVRGVGGVGVYAPFCETILAGDINPGKRVVNAAEVGDHHAIIPTGKSPTSQRLEPDEKRIFDLVARRFLAALSDVARFEITQIIVEIEPRSDRSLDPAVEHPAGEPLRFRARGRICTQEGWRAVDPPAKKKSVDLPLLEPGQSAEVLKAQSEPGQTRPPRPHNDASLLKAMETAGRSLEEADLKRALRGAGLGTPATRASILQTLIHRGYVKREGKKLHATPRGASLVSAVPIDELKSAQLTGEWESRLTKMAEGKEPRESFMADIRDHVSRMVEQIRVAEPPPPERAAQPEGPVLGECPVCREPVRETPKVFRCDTGRACTFVVFKTIAKRKVSNRMIKQMLKDGKTPILKGFKSKKGKDFSAAIRLDEEGKTRFEFEPRKERSEDWRSASVRPIDPVGMRCRRCAHGRVIAGRSAWGCDQWREGCELRIPFRLGERQISAEDAISLLLEGRTGELSLDAGVAAISPSPTPIESSPD